MALFTTDRTCCTSYKMSIPGGLWAGWAQHGTFCVDPEDRAHGILDSREQHIMHFQL